MSDERAQELGEEDFGGGEERVREEEVGEGEEEVGSDEEFSAENEVSEGEEFGAGNEFGEGKESYSVENDGEKTSESSPNKRVKETPIDLLSALPDILLFRILSFLDTKEAAITSVLSKRWQFLWMYLPCLNFCESSRETEKLRKFVAWVGRTLIIHNAKDLLDFEVEFAYDRCFASDVNVWVESIVKNKVIGVSLLLSLSSCKDPYTLPQLMFYNSSLERLRMRGCIIAPRRTIEWRSLHRLYLEEMEVPQHVIEKILSGCPDLSNFLLRACWGFNRLEVSQKLDAFGVGDRVDGKNEPLLEISAPNTTSMIITQYPRGRRWRLTNIPLLETANIDFNGSDWDASSVEVMSNMKYLFETLQHVKELDVGWRCIEVLSMMAVNGWQLPQSRQESLTINVSSDEHSIPGIVVLLESYPNLETLVINGYCSREASVTLDPAARRDLDWDLLHLKTVHITISPDPNLTGEPMLTLAQILLKRATVLEKMVIDVEYTSDFVNVIQTLLGYPRSSKNASIILR